MVTVCDIIGFSFFGPLYMGRYLLVALAIGWDMLGLEPTSATTCAKEFRLADMLAHH